jgi:hypothetical protein
MQSMLSQPVSQRSILILRFQLHLGLVRGLFPFGFRTNILNAFLFSHIRECGAIPLLSHTSSWLGA